MSVTLDLNLLSVPNTNDIPARTRDGRYSQKQPTNGDYYTGKVDWNVSAKYSSLAVTLDSSRISPGCSDHVLGSSRKTSRTAINTPLGANATDIVQCFETSCEWDSTALYLVSFSIRQTFRRLTFIPGQPFGRHGFGALHLGATSTTRFFRMNNFQPATISPLREASHSEDGVVMERFQWNTANFNRIGGDYNLHPADFLQAKVQSVVVQSGQ